VWEPFSSSPAKIKSKQLSISQALSTSTIEGSEYVRNI